MTTVTENDIIQINQKIDNLTDKVDKLTETVTKLAIGQVELKGEIKALEENVNGQIKALEENVNGQIKALEENVNGQIKILNETVKGIDKRLDNIEILNRLVSGGVIVGILLALVKYLFFSYGNII